MNSATSFFSMCEHYLYSLDLEYAISITENLKKVTTDAFIFLKAHEKLTKEVYKYTKHNNINYILYNII